MWGGGGGGRGGGVNNKKNQKLVEGSTSVSQIYHLSIPGSLSLPH